MLTIMKKIVDIQHEQTFLKFHACCYTCSVFCCNHAELASKNQLWTDGTGPTTVQADCQASIGHPTGESPLTVQ